MSFSLRFLFLAFPCVFRTVFPQEHHITMQQFFEEGLSKLTTFQLHCGLCSMSLGYRLVINDGKEGAQASLGFADLMGLRR